jgi:uncharacterized protein YukE
MGMYSFAASDKPIKDSSKIAGAGQSNTPARKAGGMLDILSGQLARTHEAADFQQHSALNALYTHLVELNNKLEHIEAKIEGEAAEIVAYFKRVL